MKKTLLLIGVVFGLTVFTSPALYAANPLEKACNNSNYTAKQRQELKEAGACGSDGSKNPISGGTDSLLYNITRIVSVAAGTIAVIMAIVGGINMMVSSGDSQKFANGRSTLIFAAVGLIIVILAQALITFVINRVTT